MMNPMHDEMFLKRALQQAQLRRGFCSPNPAVGAVVVKNGQIISEGCHWQCGLPHAEAAALKALGKQAEGTSLYVTLEPCSHQGRTPPCTDLIIQSGVKQVFFGIKDPNPKVQGNGAEILSKAGVPCKQIVCSEVETFYHSYRHWLSTGAPWVTLKLAISLDGKIAGAQGVPVEISGEECRGLTHRMRRQSDALLTSVQTILTDDPQLNVRIHDEIIAKPLYILDSRLRIPLEAKVFKTSRSLTIFHRPDAALPKKRVLENHQVRCIGVSSDETGLNLQEVITHIGQDGCHDLWVEAGGRCLQSFVRHSLANQIYFYVSPKILGPLATSAFTQEVNGFSRFTQISWSVLGNDAVLSLTT